MRIRNGAAKSVAGGRKSGSACQHSSSPRRSGGRAVTHNDHLVATAPHVRALPLVPCISSTCQGAARGVRACGFKGKQNASHPRRSSRRCCFLLLLCSGVGCVMISCDERPWDVARGVAMTASDSTLQLPLRPSPLLRGCSRSTHPDGVAGCALEGKRAPTRRRRRHFHELSSSHTGFV